MNVDRCPTEKEFDEWMSHPVTRYVREQFLAKRDTLRQQWEGGTFTDYDKGATVLVNVGNLGTCKGLAAFTELEYDDILMELENEKRIRTEAIGSSRVN